MKKGSWALYFPIFNEFYLHVYIKLAKAKAYGICQEQQKINQ